MRLFVLPIRITKLLKHHVIVIMPALHCWNILRKNDVQFSIRVHFFLDILANVRQYQNFIQFLAKRRVISSRIGATYTKHAQNYLHVTNYFLVNCKWYLCILKIRFYYTRTFWRMATLRKSRILSRVRCSMLLRLFFNRFSSVLWRFPEVRKARSSQRANFWFII